MNSSNFQFGDWVAHPSRNLMIGLDSGTEIQLEPKAMDVLIELARYQGEVVSRQQFQESVWAGRLVVDEGLTRCISELRRALGDDPKNPKYIETLSKRGYRLLSPVEWEDQEVIISPSPSSKNGKSATSKIGLKTLLTVIILIGLFLVLHNKQEHTEMVLKTPEDLFSVLENSPASTMTAFWSPVKENDGYITLRTQTLDDGADQKISMRIFDESNIRLLDTILPFGSMSEQHSAISDMIASLELLKERHANPGILKLPQSLRLLYQQAVFLATEGNQSETQEALDKFDAILLEQPNFIEGIIGKMTALRGLAVYTPLDERAKYVDLNNLLLQRLTLIQPNHPYVLAHSYRPESDQVNWEEYEQVLLNSVNELPSCFECVEKLANFYLIVGWRNKAISLYSKHLAYYPTSSVAHAELAMAYSRAGNIDGMKKHIDVVRLMNNERWVLPSEINYFEAIGDSKNWVQHWEEYHDRFGFDKASRATAAAIASADIAELKTLVNQMPRLSFNIALAAGQTDKVVARMEKNVSSGNYFDLSLLHGWRHKTNPLTKYYISGRSELQNHPRIMEMVSEVGLVEFWRARNEWPDDCELELSPAYCQYKNMDIST